MQRLVSRRQRNDVIARAEQRLHGDKNRLFGHSDQHLFG